MSSVLSVRLSDEERTLLDAASALSKTKISDFVRRKAIEAAEMSVLEESTGVLPAKDWDWFEAWVREPARENQGLKKLAGFTPTWQS